MSGDGLAQWCNEAALLVGTPGSIVSTKYPELLAKESEIAGKTLSTASWNEAKQTIADSTDDAEKDTLVLNLGKAAKRNKALFGARTLTEEELKDFETVGENYGEVQSRYAGASTALRDTGEGSLAGLANVQSMGKDGVEELKADGKLLQLKFVNAVKKKSAAEALAALKEYENFAQGLQAFDAQYSELRRKYTVLEKGKLTPGEFVTVARIEQMVADAKKEWSAAILEADDNLANGERGTNRKFFDEKIKTQRSNYEKWTKEWPKLSLFDIMDETHEYGLGGIQALVKAATALASSDEYLAPDEGLAAMRADVITKWQLFTSSTSNAQRLARRGPTASAQVQNLTQGRQWRRSYQIGDGIYTMSNSHSGDVSFKRPIPAAHRVPNRPEVKSFIYHLH